MYSPCKYVVMSTTIDRVHNENIYLFPSSVVHKAVSNKMVGVPISAGFVRQTDGQLKCLGYSDSLRLKCRSNEDNQLLEELLDL